VSACAYYNEIDPVACETLRELMAADLIAPGDVDERSICDVKPTELRGYTQCHFFAGSGIWSAALRLAGWADDRPVWTGSCPCQGYSVAGKGGGTGDNRDLWPVFAALIRERRPERILGEQVEAAIGYGWLDRLRADLEAEAYAVGGIVLGAHSAGADHIRQRLWWVALANGGSRLAGEPRPTERSVPARDGQDHGGLGIATDNHGRRGECGAQAGAGQDGKRRRGSTGAGVDGGVADVGGARLEIRGGQCEDSATPEESCPATELHGAFDLWRDARWHYCRDGKHRRVPVERGLFPLAATGSGKGYRVAALRQAGNGICLGTAAAFVTAFMAELEEAT